MTLYSMTPIASGTRLRKDHNTFAAVIASFGAGVAVVGDEIWEAPAVNPGWFIFFLRRPYHLRVPSA